MNGVWDFPLLISCFPLRLGDSVPLNNLLACTQDRKIYEKLYFYCELALAGAASIPSYKETVLLLHPPQEVVQRIWNPQAYILGWFVELSFCTQPGLTAFPNPSQEYQYL